eukprot:TRINITY_DN28227_c0_g2_i1.p1 TRINITY_DN28227_c0_g2~~TRINITY_DN28227_c0_g2_i1.p1  ORF type:complete len:135 (+),score=25.83 TRINITY_DN28227_c0_g2_i1:133-537(+)
MCIRDSPRPKQPRRTARPSRCARHSRRRRHRAWCAWQFYMINVIIDDVHRDINVVPRRYSDFENLHQQLAGEFPMVFDPKQNPNPPSLPGKKWFGNMDAAVVEERRVRLESFMQECLEYGDVLMSDEMGRFLQF